MPESRRYTRRYSKWKINQALGLEGYVVKYNVVVLLKRSELVRGSRLATQTEGGDSILPVPSDKRQGPLRYVSVQTLTIGHEEFT